MRKAASSYDRQSPLAYSYAESPVGPLLLAGDGERLHLVSFPKGSRKVEPLVHWRRDDGLFTEVCTQLQAYFECGLKSFDLPLHLGGTPFQNDVWNALAEIPFGRTMSYGALAAKLGKPGASRAVGAANGANPLPIILPCHRVIGADNSLTGFGGGLPTKEFLLRHEGTLAEQPLLI